MDNNEIKEIADAVTNSIILRLDERYTKRELGDKHERILKGSNGDVGLIEQVRSNTQSVRKLYAGVGFAGGAIVLEILNILFDLF